MTTADLPEIFRDLRDRRILVTGVGGFIGGALFRRLAGYGLQVTGTVLFADEVDTLQREGLQARRLDLTSDGSWNEYVEGIDLVFHIAAAFQEVEKSEDYYDAVNHRAVVKLAQAAARAGVSRFVHCSTVGVHGNVKEIPATEETPYNPMDVYHRTKLQGELALLGFARTLPADGMTVTVNRPAMVYGPGDLRMLKLYQAIFRRRFFMIGSGETLAHLGYIEDQVDSFLLCAVQPRSQVHLESFNIASSQPIKLNDMARIIAREGQVSLSRFHLHASLVWLVGLACELLWKPFGKRPPIFRRRVGFFLYNRAFDISKARDRLNYNPRWSESEGLSAAIQWYKQHGYL